MNYKHTMTYKDFCKLIKEYEVYSSVCNIFEKNDMSYETLVQRRRDVCILDIIKKIDENKFSPPGKQKWEAGWGKNLEKYKKSKDSSSLIPGYRSIDAVCRLRRTFILPNSQEFESNFYTALNNFIAEKYFSKCSSVFEFGCGPGSNLKTISKILPDKQLYGLDWVQPAVDSVNLLRDIDGIKTQGLLFDMFVPDYNIEVPENSGFYTFHALEQLGDNYMEFINFVLNKKPSIVVHVEPFIEFYNDNILVDYLAIKFHQVRKYIDGYYKELLNLERLGKLKILKSTRIGFGSYYQDNSMCVIWKPIN